MRRLFRKETVVVVLSLMMWIVSSEPAHAQGPGVRAGVSVDPDQFYFGGHYETGELIDRLYLQAEPRSRRRRRRHAPSLPTSKRFTRSR